MPPRARIGLFGIRCAFSSIVFDALAVAGRRPVALFLPGPPGQPEPIRPSAPPGALLLTPSQPPSANLAHAAHRQGVEVYLLGDTRSEATAALLEGLALDVIVVACFPQFLPRRVRQAASVTALNVHPTLLPDKRGPDPLFWLLREGNGAAGVTVHLLTGRFDAGPVIAQEPLMVEDGITESALERGLAALGGRLVVEVLERLESGPLVPTPQDEASATYAPFPRAEDFVIDTHRSARAAFNFLRGVAGRGEALYVRDGDKLLCVNDALAWQEDEPDQRDVPPGAAIVRFEPGYLIAHLEPVSLEAVAT